MAKMHELTIIFDHDEKRSVRDKELAKSKIRSHAARVSHQRRTFVNPPGSSRSKRVHPHQCTELTKCEICTTKLNLCQPQSITRHDPFASWPGHDLPSFCIDIHELALEKGWVPLFAPVRPNETLMLKNSWKQAIVHYPFLFHAQAAASIDWAILAADGQDPSRMKQLLRIQLEQRQLALKTLTCEVSKPSLQVTDALVHAVGLLACSGKISRSVEPYPISPLGLLQNIYPFGNVDPVMAHVHAAYELVRLKGGLITVKKYGVSIVLELVDLYLATRYGRIPGYPLSRPQVLPLDTSIATGLPDSPGVGTKPDAFNALETSDYTLCQILRDMTDLTSLATTFYQTPTNTALTTTLTLGRNEIQHRLLVLPTSQLSAAAFHTLPLSTAHNDPRRSELIRLAALIYSDMVFFPLPWNTGVKPRLARRMRELWHRTPFAELDIWLLWFGCFAAYLSPHQSWLEGELRMVLNHYYSHTTGRMPVMFDTLKDTVLSKFLWWEMTCDAPGRELWVRARSGERGRGEGKMGCE